MPLTTSRQPREGPEVPAGWSTDEGSQDELPPKPDRDEIFEILRASRRREVLRYLDAHGGEAKIGAIAEYIAAEENDVARSDVTSPQRKRAYVGLHQMHLPKMDGFGVVEWDKDRGFVELRDSAWWLLAYLYFDPEPREPEPQEPDGPLAGLRRAVGELLGGVGGGGLLGR